MISKEIKYLRNFHLKEQQIALAFSKVTDIFTQLLNGFNTSVKSCYQINIRHIWLLSRNNCLICRINFIYYFPNSGCLFMKEFSERLNHLAKKYKSIRQFALDCGLNPDTFKHYIKSSKNKSPSIPSGETLSKIFTSTKCNPSWLLTGKGEPFPEEKVLIKGSSLPDILKNKKKTEIAERLIELLKGVQPNNPSVNAIKTFIDLALKGKD